MPKPAPMTLLDTSRNVKRGNRRGTLEIWEACSADGVWKYVREEDVRTEWHVEHLPTGRVLLYTATSLASARRVTASGWVLAELDHRDAARAAAEQAQEVAA